jgi:hypothetical protein
MEKYTVELKDKDGLVVLKHNLFAKNDMDAESKCNVLLKNVRNNTVSQFNCYK